MEISGRNQLSATVREVKRGDIMAEVVMELAGGQIMVAAVTRASVDHLDIKPGDTVTAIVKATDVMVGA